MNHFAYKNFGDGYYVDYISLFCLIVSVSSSFKLQLKALDAANDNEIQGVARIGEKLKFEINLQDPTNAVKTSPQNCYATRLNGTGRYNLISNR